MRVYSLRVVITQIQGPQTLRDLGTELSGVLAQELLDLCGDPVRVIEKGKMAGIV